MQTAEWSQLGGEGSSLPFRLWLTALVCSLQFASFISSTACARRPSSPAPAFEAAPPDLLVLTWNVHAGAGDLDRLLGDLRRGKITRTAPLNAFVLLLQEAGTDVLEMAQKEGLASYFEAVHPGRGNAIVSTQPLIEPRTIELPRERQRRVAVAATIVVGDTPLAVASAHFENRVSWWRGGLFSEGARFRQAEALIAALSPDKPAIVGGDFNAWLGRNEPAWRALAARFPDGPPPLANPTFRDRLFLDEVFFDLPDGWAAERLVVEDRYGSDHHPVVALLDRPR